MSTMTLSLLLPDLRGGGAERISLDLARELARLGHRVEFVLMRAEGDFLAEAQAEFPVVDLRAPRARQVIGPLTRYLRNRRPKGLLAAMWPLTVIAPVAARIARYPGPVAISEHSTLYTRQYKDWGRLHLAAMRASGFIGYRLASSRIGVSQGVCDDMALMSRLPLDRMTVIHNPVRALAPPDAAARARADALWGVPAGRRVLNVGSLKDQKNHPLLLRAFAQVGDGAARLMILGQGDEAPLRALADELGIAGQLILPGFHADPSPFYATADLFVLSSDYEGFGNVIVEALSCGLPVVSTDCHSGPAEILENGRWGRLTPVGDAPALARAMAEALAEAPDRDALRRRAAHFSPERAARAYLAAMGLQ